MKIGIISDTHGHVPHTRDAIRLLESLDVERVIHCGDIGSTQVIDLLSSWPTHYVLGNVDRDRESLQEAADVAGHTLHGDAAELHWDGVRIAVTHGHLTDIQSTYIHSGQWELVCVGHTHVANKRYRGRTLVLNPGALFRAKVHSIAYVDTDATVDGYVVAEIIPIH